MAYLSPDYACDALSFFNYPKLQGCRLVSHSIKANIVSYTHAGRRLQKYDIYVGSAVDFGWPRIEKEEYANSELK